MTDISPEHFLWELDADGVAVVKHTVGAAPNGDDGGFVENDTFPLDANQGVAGSQVDAHVDAECAKKRVENHRPVSFPITLVPRKNENVSRSCPSYAAEW